MGVAKEANTKPVKYPRSVFFIVVNEFCERFSYYGLRTILSIYLKDVLRYTEDAATVIYHIFTMFCYFFPLFGAMLADSFLGKFKTILYLSVVYAIGNIVLSFASADTAIPGLPAAEVSIIGLLLISVGTGGIKPCVSAFGGDQFVMPQQEKQLVQFFSLFYFAINSGSLLSTFLTPILREDVTCLNQSTCYPLAFGVPAILMIVSLVVFVLGSPLYKVKKPEGNVVLQVSKCIGYAISQKAKSKDIKREHWLDHADDKHDKKLIEDIKGAFQVLYLFIPLPFFWALFDQQGSRWTFQATRMTGELGNWSLKPDQMQVINPLLILVFIPIFETIIYPLLAKCKLLKKPLQRLGTGGVLAAISFIISAIVELQLQPTYPVLPSAGEAQIRIFNGMNCSQNFSFNQNLYEIQPYEMWANKHIPAKDAEKYEFSIHSSCGASINYRKNITAYEKEATTYILNDGQVSEPYMNDEVDKSENGQPLIRIMYQLTAAHVVNLRNPDTGEVKHKISIKPGQNVTKTQLVEVGRIMYQLTAAHVVNLRNPDTGEVKHKISIKPGQNVTKTQLVEVGRYSVDLDDITNLGHIVLKIGGVYNLFVSQNGANYIQKLHTITEPNSIHMLWLIPQYVVMTMGEVMFSITGLEFSYSQAPVSMKSVITSGWLISVAFGNLIVVIIAEAKFFDSQANEFFLFAVLMLIDMAIFALMARKYKYAKVEESDELQTVPIEKMKNQGLDNQTFVDDNL